MPDPATDNTPTLVKIFIASAVTGSLAFVIASFGSTLEIALDVGAIVFIGFFLAIVVGWTLGSETTERPETPSDLRDDSVDSSDQRDK